MQFSPRVAESATSIYRQHLRSLFAQTPADLFVTLAYNANLAAPTARRNLKHFSAVVDRSLIGPRWQCRERTFFVSVQEDGKLHDNTHQHLLLRLAPGVSKARFRTVVPSLFRKIAPGGSINIQDINGRAELAKYLQKASQVDFLISTELQTSTR